jgi:hypothetical protein
LCCARILIGLKKAGLSEKVINAMVEKNSGGSAPSAAPAAPATAAPLVDEVGIYFKNTDNKWVEILPAVVNWKTGSTYQPTFPR